MTKQKPAEESSRGRPIAIYRSALVAACLFAAGCASKPNVVEVVDPEQGIICHWGQQRFDLCALPNDEQRVAALLDAMTLDEKLGQMTQSVWHNGVTPNTITEFGIGSIIHTQGPVPGSTPEQWMDNFDRFQRAAMNTRLGIPLLVGVDAVHGQNTYAGATIFPHNIGMAATRNYTLIQQAAEITAIEVAGTGFNWTFSPCIAMPGNEYWGRVYEGFSEDRDLTTKAVRASVQGHQGSSLRQRDTVAATAKHFIADGATDGGVEGGDAILSEQRLRETYLPPYAAAVDAGVASVMVGFNSVNGINMHQHGELVNNVLKKELGFEGVVLTDWDGGQRFGPAHTVINAGIDMAMQPGNHEEFITDLKSSVLNGTVSVKRIDDAVSRILRMKFKLGLFTDPLGKREFISKIGSADHRAVARRAVRESLVLLKSENDALPLRASERITVVGTHANNSGLQSGGWTVNWQGTKESYAGATSVFEAISSVANHAELAETGCSAELAADKIVMVIGEQPYAEGFGDTNRLRLDAAQRTMLDDCLTLEKPIIIILVSGRVMAIKPELDKSDAFIAAWLPGSEGGGVADFLFATNNFKPVGKSPYAWPILVDDLPLDKYDERALFPFGYGLQEY